MKSASITFLLLTAVTGFAQSGSPVLTMKESRWLFLDLAEIDRMEGVRQHVNPPDKVAENPVLEGTPGQWDHPRVKFYGTVMREPETGLWRMWYSGTQDNPAGLAMTSLTDARHVGYAESSDGIHWKKPKLGIIDYLGSKENNLVLLDGQAPSVFDLRRLKVAGEKRRYRMYVESFGGEPRGSLNFRWLASDDGLHWDEEGRISEKELPIELAHVLYDPEDPNPGRRWKAYSLLMDMQFPARKLGVVLSPDGRKWSQPAVIMHPQDGMEDEDHYGGVTRYAGYYIMLYDFMYRGHNTATELAVSRDGIHFTRIQNGTKVLPLGKPGEFDSSMLVVGEGFLTIDGKHYQYYTGSDKNYQEGSSRSGLGLPWRRSIGLALWRQDGFTDMRVAEGRGAGEMVTHPVAVTDAGDYELWVNASVPGPRNELRVQILDGQTRQVIPGFATSDSLSGVNQLQRPIGWGGSTGLSRVGTKSIRIRFVLEGPEARLYSFGFRKRTRSK